LLEEKKMPISEELSKELDTSSEQFVAEQEAQKEPDIQDEPEVESEEKDVGVAEEGDEGSNSEDDAGIDSSESGEVKPEVEVKAAVVEQPVIGDDAITMAVRAGIPYGDARRFPDEESLKRATASIERVRETLKPKDNEPDPLEEIRKKLDPEKYEPEVIETFDSLLNVVKKQRDELKALSEKSENVVSQNTRSQQEQTSREITEWFDSQVNKLGDEYSDVLGKGSVNSLDQKSPQYAKRDAIASRIAIMMAGYNVSGMNPPPRDEMFNDAARLVLGDEMQRVKDAKLAKDLQERGSQHLQRVRGKGQKHNQSPIEEAAAMIDAKYFAKK
jgi:hypothetical protein